MIKKQPEGYAILIGSSSFPLWVESKPPRTHRSSYQSTEENQESCRKLGIAKSLALIMPGVRWVGPAGMRQAASSALAEMAEL